MIRSVVELSFRPPRLLGWAPSVPSAPLGGLRASGVSLISLTPPVISMPPVSLAVLAPPTLAIPVISMPLMLLTILVPPVPPRPLVPLVPLVLLVLTPGLLIPALRLQVTVGALGRAWARRASPPSIPYTRPILNSGEVQRCGDHKGVASALIWRSLHFIKV